MTAFEDEYLDVLQNIEFAILQVYHRHRGLTDYEVDKALNALIQAYRRSNPEQPRSLRSNRLAQEVFTAVKEICDWRSGSSPQDSIESRELPSVQPVTTDEILACLKRIRRSIQTWTRQGGRQGYLNYIDQFLG